MAELEMNYPSGDRHEAALRAVTEIERLPGVIAAAVWLNSDGHLRDARVHILPGVTPMIIGNAASRVLEAVGIPHEQPQVRLVHVALPDEIQALPAGGRFLLLQDFTLTRSGAHVICSVRLLRDNVPATGEARELDTAGGRARAAATATLRAAENTNSSLAMGLEAAVVMHIFGRDYAIVAVEASIGRRVGNLSGLVLLDPARAPEEAVCLATLRAIDRWIAL